ncbi:MAG: NADH-quinone oxidoreductase subunit C [Flavobacteriales bacterium]|jgi:NADH-quinone oxidoreductase subunit C
MTNNTLLDALQVQLGSKIITSEVLYDTLVIEISPSEAFDVVELLKNDATLSFNFLTLIGAVHYPEEKGRELCVVYHLHSWKNAIRLRIKSYLSQENPSIKSLTPLFDGANWQERETFDFFGIQFEGHPNMARILNMEEMDYHPMLKQYHLEDGTREDKDDRFFGR